MSKKEIVSIVLLMIFSLSAKSFAQNQPQTQSEKVKEFFKERDPLSEVLTRVKTLQEDYEAKQGGMDQDTANVVRSLKNPFLPQLPVAKPPEIIKSTPINVPVPTPGESSPLVEAVRPPQTTVTGLVWHTDRPQAILNGQIVNIGDKVDLWTVVNITQKGVELTFGGKNFLIEPPKITAEQNPQNR